MSKKFFIPDCRDCKFYKRDFLCGDEFARCSNGDVREAYVENARGKRGDCEGGKFFVVRVRWWQKLISIVRPPRAMVASVSLYNFADKPPRAMSWADDRPDRRPLEGEPSN